MKRLALSILLLLLAAVAAPAQLSDISHTFDQFTAANCSSPPCESATFCTPVLRVKHTLTVDVGGTVAATTCTFNLQGARTRTGPYGIISDRDGNDLECTADTIVFISDTPVRCLKFTLETFSGGTAPTVDVHYDGTR